MAKNHGLTKKSKTRDPSYVLMNKNKPAKKYKVGSRTQRNLRFVYTPTSSTDALNIIDIGQSLSAMNRRAYTQGAYYYVSKVTIHNQGNAWVRLVTVPDTWVTKEAWRRANRIYHEQLTRTLHDADANLAVVGKYHDFRVGINSNHDFANNLLPANYLVAPTNEFGSDEWSQSVVVSGDPASATTHAGDELTMHMIGASIAGSSIGLIRSYASSRPQPQASDPSVPSDLETDPLSMIFNDGDTMDEVLDNIDTDYDGTPYELGIYPGEQSVADLVVQTQLATGDGAGTVATSGPLCVPFGLLGVVVDNDGGSVGAIEVNIELTPGPYHGVYAERIE